MSDDVQQSEVISNPSENGDGQQVVNQAIGDLTNQVKQLGQNQVALQQMFAQQMQRPQESESQQQPEQNRYVNNIPDTDLETLSRRELVELIETKLISAVGDSVKPITDKISNLESNVNARTLQQQVNEARSKYKDFDNFQQDMLGLHKQHPTLNVDQLYHEARRQFPDKAIKEEPPKPPEPPKKEGFGGFFPSSAAARDPERKRNMGSREAVETAWQQIFGE